MVQTSGQIHITSNPQTHPAAYPIPSLQTGTYCMSNMNPPMMETGSNLLSSLAQRMYQQPVMQASTAPLSMPIGQTPVPVFFQNPTAVVKSPLNVSNGTDVPQPSSSSLSLAATDDPHSSPPANIVKRMECDSSVPSPIQQLNTSTLSVLSNPAPLNQKEDISCSAAPSINTDVQSTPISDSHSNIVEVLSG